MRIVIVGCGSAGISALKWLTYLMRNVEIVVIEKRDYHSYSPCGMPYAIEGLTEINKLKHTIPTPRNVEILLRTEVVEVDSEKVVCIKDGKEISIEYDKLIYAAGATPIKPNIPGIDLNNVFKFKTIEDLEILENFISPGRRLSVIGGGAIGIEVAYALKKRGCEVRLFEIMPGLLPALGEEEFSAMIKDYLEKHGINVHLSEKIERIEGDNKVERVISDKGRYECDGVILATGVIPNTKPLRGLVDMNEKGFIIVDEYFRTSKGNIYAVGDCILTKTLWNSYVPAQLASVASKHGMIAAMHIAGVSIPYRGSTIPFVSKIGELEIASVGRKTSKFVRVKARAKPEFISKEEIIIKMYFDEDLRVVGCCALGSRAAEMINIISLAMLKGATLEDLLISEFSYCPITSDINNPISLCAELAYRRFGHDRKNTET